MVHRQTRSPLVWIILGAMTAFLLTGCGKPPPPLTIQLKSYKNSYLQREPIRVVVTLRNAGENIVSLNYRPFNSWRGYLEAIQVDFFYIDDGGNEVALSSNGLEEKYLVHIGGGYCHMGGPLSTWIVKPHEKYAYEYLLPNRFSTGKTRIKAVITLSAGKWKGAKYFANIETIEILKPDGKNATAYDFIIKHGTALEGLDYVYKDYQSYAKNGDPLPADIVHDSFLEKHGDSVYADYVRYNLYFKSDVQLPGDEKFSLKSFPDDFPFLEDAYIAMCHTDSKESQTQYANELKKRHPKFVGPNTSHRLQCALEGAFPVPLSP